MTQPKNSEQNLIMETAQSRKELRQRMRRLRQEMTTAHKQACDAQIGRQILDWCRQHQPTSMAVYWPIQSEPDLLSCYQQLQQMGVALALPVVTAKDQPLSFLEWQAGDSMTVDPYGIAIPDHGRLLSQPAVLLIPCLGWNADGYRLGYGGGFYDRSLARLPRPFAIGVAYTCTQAEFAAEAHDIPMDIIIRA